MTLAARPEAPEDNRKSSISLDNGSSPRRPEAALPDFAGPREFGRLLLLQAIARGGMGEVYLAAMGDIEGAERPCVVKLIRREHRDDASFLARFLDEARIQAQMQHPGVAQVLEAAIDPEGQPYVVVEYVPGRDLSEVRQRAAQLKLSISWSDAVAIAASIAEALAHVHERTDHAGRPLGVVHRDLSPQNIMVSYVGETKLIDFGTARGENRRCQTINGIVFAKPGYVAPEVAANTPGGVPADLYALGIVLWELIAGRRFLQGDSQEHLAAVAKGERTPPALSLWLALPRELDAIIAKLTAPRIEDRFASAREAADRLLELSQQAPSLANGERSVQARIAHLMLRLYPAEPAQSRSEFVELVAAARKNGGVRPEFVGSPRPAPTESKDALFPGTRYRIVREIAKGPMSAVYEAQHVDLGRTVALKVLDKSRCRSPEAAERFRHEARVVAQLRHENLVHIHDFGISREGRPYYAMEYLKGETLAERLGREGRLPWAEVVRLGIQACQALEAAHALGVVHRDIKPANLLLGEGGTLKLLDFGITQSDAVREREAGESLVLTGTPEYMAPEQIGEAHVDGRADIYALGAVLYELLTGTLPHTGPNTVALLDSKVHDAVPAPSQRVKKLRLPRYLDRVLLTALATDTKDRYDNVTGLRQDLVWILGSVERGRKERRRALTGALAFSGAAALVGLLALDGLPEREPALAIEETRALTRDPPAPSPDDTATSAVSAAVATDTESRAGDDSPAGADSPSSADSLANADSPSSAESAPPPPATEAAEPSAETTAALPADEAQPEPAVPASPAAAPSPEAPEPKAPKAVDRELEEALAHADGLRGQHNLRALEAFRRLGERYAEEPRVLEGWSRVAARTKWWGESLKVAERWAALDPSPAAHVHLARTQKRLGQVEKAITTLKQLLERHPKEPEAQHLLHLYGGTPVAMN